MPIDENQRSRSRDLRRNATDAERLLWKHLRQRQFEGLHFRRQVPIGSYFADFLCHQYKLIVEIDGGHHNSSTQTEYDKTRDDFLRDQGFQVLRFWNNDVMGNLEGVLSSIRMAVKERDRLPPPEKPD